MTWIGVSVIVVVIVCIVLFVIFGIFKVIVCIVFVVLNPGCALLATAAECEGLGIMASYCCAIFRLIIKILTISF